MQASAVARAYAEAERENPVAAHDRFVGRRIKITGVVYNISFYDESPSYYPYSVSINTPGQQERITCFFAGDSKAAIAGLRRGQNVVVEGTLEFNSMSYEICLSECEFSQ